MSAGQTSEISPAPLTIEQAENGYIVYRSLDQLGLRGSDYARKPHVFPSKAALFAHLAEHFTHEAVSVPMDAAPLPLPVIRGMPGESVAGFTDFNRRPA